MMEKYELPPEHLAANLFTAMKRLESLTDIGVTGAEMLDPISLGYDEHVSVTGIYMDKYLVFTRLTNVRKLLGQEHVLTVEYPILHLAGPVDGMILQSIAETVTAVVPFSLGVMPDGGVTICARAQIAPDINAETLFWMLNTDLHLLSTSIEPAREAANQWIQAVNGSR